ncbi:hypothetical protein [Allosphingosinicella deserti]|nr:hypothetical protein [Sphingomonas deserti]
MIIRYAVSIALAACLPAVAAPPGPSQNLVAAQFDGMKALVGIWRPADATDSPLRIRFSLTAGGTVLVEEWTRNGRPHSLTLYHRDGAGLIATHYCPQGNQPRLTLLPTSQGRLLRFEYRDATDLDPENESHVTALAFDLSDPALLLRSESYRKRGVSAPSELRLVRVQ